ncbi:MAG: outer membrane lipoprotein-sorting protein [Proteobacteria bacterium]|nr:outer membrane lipoprotein-sorting protein [Pseudomonadota bacterium]
MQKHLATLFILMITMTLITPAFSFADDPKAREIMQKVDDRDNGDNRTNDMLMVLIDKNNDERKKYFKIFSKDHGKDTHTIMFIVDPPSIKNTGFLTLDYDDPTKDDDQFLYLPALGKSKRIASNDKNGSFMGSDMNYSDMSSRELPDYDFKLLKELDLKGAQCWLIESTPRSEKVMDETGYKKSIYAIRQDNYMVTRIKAWTTEGDYIKLIDFDDLQKIEGIWVSLSIKVIKKRGDDVVHKTDITISQVAFNQNLADDIFSKRRLEKGL